MEADLLAELVISAIAVAARARMAFRYIGREQHRRGRRNGRKSRNRSDPSVCHRAILRRSATK